MIENDYWKTYYLQDIALEVGVSKFHLNRVFKHHTGYTPRTYLEKVRINHARQLLQTANLNGIEIGFQVGYQSTSSFYKAFQRCNGCTPKQFQVECLKAKKYK
ncbi:MAG: helix-turn-helix transcriptional regulator [Virgibacillus sp.]|nr:helix-turn-helix transcriptional regulator [Virgibacillus sp.]